MVVVDILIVHILSWLNLTTHCFLAYKGAPPLDPRSDPPPPPENLKSNSLFVRFLKLLRILGRVKYIKA